ncbi:MAG TPA: DNA polymerase III subunit gamma/tau [Candidatus Dormibacteraeota bacterium]|nr:DNA polymerase III subunit gamma/tau [Candidatus Dormibacteraeota bacterium]
MSLYRTWRPKSFTELVGQDAVVQTLCSAIEGNKLAHAYLFSGPRGSGKTSAAKILARCVNCELGPTVRPDNSCPSCLAMLEGGALDVLEIDAASNRGIDEIRSLRDAVKFPPAAMHKKIYIIDEAHMLTKEGANAFLKTLEEPPDHALFILATTEPERLPVTILSRCQRYAFRRIAIPVMIARMREIAAAERIEIDESALAAIAYRADGGLRDALTMLEQAAAYGNGRVDASTIALAFGSNGREMALRLRDSVLARDAGAMLRTIEESSDAGIEPSTLLRALLGAMRDLLVARIDPALLARDSSPEDAAEAQARSASVQTGEVLPLLRVLTDAATLARGGDARLELESALLRFVLAGESTGAAPAAARPSTPAVKSVAKAAASPSATAASPPATVAPPRDAGPLTQAGLEAAWPTIRDRVVSANRPLQAALEEARVASFDGKTMLLTLSGQTALTLFNERASAKVKAEIAAFLGADLNVRAEIAAQPDADAAMTNEEAHSLLNYAIEKMQTK